MCIYVFLASFPILMKFYMILTRILYIKKGRYIIVYINWKNELASNQGFFTSISVNLTVLYVFLNK